jgi:hypothetical protein
LILWCKFLGNVCLETCKKLKGRERERGREGERESMCLMQERRKSVSVRTVLFGALIWANDRGVFGINLCEQRKLMVRNGVICMIFFNY